MAPGKGLTAITVRDFLHSNRNTVPGHLRGICQRRAFRFKQQGAAAFVPDAAKLTENTPRQIQPDQVVGRVHDFADAEVSRHAA